jgi:hypothetical protein
LLDEGPIVGIGVPSNPAHTAKGSESFPVDAVPEELHPFRMAILSESGLCWVDIGVSNQDMSDIGGGWRGGHPQE